MNDTKDSALVLVPKQFGKKEKFLVYIAPEGRIFAGQYRFIGGKIKENEDCFTTVKRESIEEFRLNLSKAELLYEKGNVLGGKLFLCSGATDDEPMKNEEDVGEPEWKTAKELFESNLVPNCKIALYCYLKKNNLVILKSITSIIKNDSNFISFLNKEAKDLQLELTNSLV